MTEEESDVAFEVTQILYDKLRKAVFKEMTKAKLNAEQIEYVENYLHEELRYWP